MSPEQWHWLAQVGIRISSLLAAIAEGNVSASTALGERIINGRRVRLLLLVEVVDAGADPLQSHASVNFPAPPVSRPPEFVTPIPRHRKRARRR